MSNIGISRSSDVTNSKLYKTDRTTGRIIMSSEIYSNLSSLIKNSVLTYHVDPKSGFEEFIKDYNDLYLPESTLTTEQHDMMVRIDLYLGSLGLAETYPIPRDRVGNQQKINANYKGIKNG